MTDAPTIREHDALVNRVKTVEERQEAQAIAEARQDEKIELMTETFISFRNAIIAGVVLVVGTGAAATILGNHP